MSETLKDAFRKYLDAAEQGNPKAQFIVGDMYSKGLGVPQDKDAAEYWYTLAAEQRVVAAQFMLGQMYGYESPKNYVLAYMWSCIAALEGHTLALGECRLFAKEMTPSQIEEAQQVALLWIDEHRSVKWMKKYRSVK